MNPAHFFTLLRICISPLFPIIYLGYEWLDIPFAIVPYLLLALLVVSEFSDVFDGFLARRRNQVTDLGKVLDPMADTITHISLFLAFTQGFVQLPMVIVLIFLYREFFISTLRTLCALRGVALAARPSGKIKAIMQAVVAFGIVGLMIPTIEGYLSQEHFQLISLIAVSIAAGYTALSAIDYCYSNRAYIKKAVHS